MHTVKRLTDQRIACAGCGKGRLQSTMIPSEIGFICKSCINGTSVASGWRKNKYNAKKTEYKGYTYDSHIEAFEARNLDMRLLSGEILAWEKQVPIRLAIDGYKLGQTYYCDFKVTHLDESVEYIEIKSKATQTPLWKLKFAITEYMMRNDPNVTLTVKVG